MKMILKLLGLGTVLIGTTFLDKTIYAYYDLDLPDFIHLPFYICAYFVFLFLEIRSKLLNSTSHRKLRWMGFQFTFWSVLLWLAITSIILDGYTPDKFFGHPRYNVYFRLTLATWWGILAGVVGMLITQLMVLFIFKQPEEL